MAFRVSSFLRPLLAVFAAGLTAAVPAGCATVGPDEPVDSPHTRTPLIPVKGSRADLHSRPGTTGDRTLAVDCQKRDCVAVRAPTGTRRPSMDLETFNVFRGDVRRACQDVVSLFSSGLSSHCHRDVPGGLILWIYDWREADTTIDCAARALATQQSDEEITICVSPSSPSENEGG
jgi:hypothetical protein